MDSIINYYEKILLFGLFKIKPLLIECLVNYYGEYYEKTIVERLNKTNFIFYCNENITKLFKFSKKNYSKSYNYERLFTDAKEIKSELINKNKHCNDENKSLNRIIYSSKPKEWLDKNFVLYSDNYIFKDKLTCMSINKNNELYERFVYIPLFLTPDQSIIHEIIHAIVSDVIGIINEEKCVSKTGLIIGNDMNSWYLEEAITDIEACKIYSDFKINGGDFLDNYCCQSKQTSGYNLIRPLAEEFYICFKEEIIHSRFTLDKNLLINMCGKKMYNQYSHTINECYKIYPDKRDFYEYQYIANRQVEEMKAHKKQLVISNT